MTTSLETSEIATIMLSIEAVQVFLYREARFLDNKEWEEWLGART